MTEFEKRKRGDVILEKMNRVVSNQGTGSYFDVGSKSEMRKEIVRLWRELKEIDPERAEIVKPQNPYVK